MDTSISTDSILSNIIDKIMNALQLSNEQKIQIKRNIKSNLLTSKLTNETLVNKINQLIENDKELNNFQQDHINNLNLRNAFNNLKSNLGKLQVLVLLKKLKSATSCDDVLNNFINVMNNKIDNINNILMVDQSGGSHYYNKYIKYKKKYIILKHLIL